MKQFVRLPMKCNDHGYWRHFFVSRESSIMEYSGWMVGCIYNLLGGSMGTSSVLTMALTSSDPGSTAIMEARRLESGWN